MVVVEFVALKLASTVHTRPVKSLVKKGVTVDTECTALVGVEIVALKLASTVHTRPVESDVKRKIAATGQGIGSAVRRITFVKTNMRA